MTNFIIGAIFGIVILLLCIYIIAENKDRKIKKELGEDCVNVMMPKSIADIKQNVTICINDGPYTAEHLDDDHNIIAFMTFYPSNIKSANFYYSLLENKQIITIIYNDEEYRKYYAIITQIKLIDKDTLRIYYTVINNYVEN